MRLLIVEDDLDLARILKKHFKSAGYGVDESQDGEDALQLLTSKINYDAVILDIMLPSLDGLEVLRRARKEGCRAPVILLTARGTIQDRVEGLDSGADDYMSKPFALEELEARVRALIRRGPVTWDAVLRIADLELDPATHKVQRGGEDIELSSREFSILEYMMRNCGVVLSRRQIEAHIWNAEGRTASNVVDVYIRYLRKKIDEGRDLRLIHTVRGAGYRLDVNP